MMRFDSYDLQGFYDEMFQPDGQPRPGARILAERINSLSDGELEQRQQSAERALWNMGITFNVYGSKDGAERIWPFDIVPRIVPASEWDVLERGLRQRIRALNMFIQDVYDQQKIIRAGIVPHDLVHSAKGFLPQCVGLRVPKNIWCHVTGTDLVRDSNGQYYVLEDNARCPSGVSYVLENRQVMKRTFPVVFTDSRVRPVDDYPSRLIQTLQYLSRYQTPPPEVALLTPGIYNSAYYEHSFLARQMGVELVQGDDLVVHDGFVMMRTTRGLQRVDVIYRRIDDTFLDPQAFNPDSLLGVPGLMEVYRAGNVALANAPGTGVADDKVIYAFVPDMIRHYLSEEPIIPNVPTYLCWREKERQHVLLHLAEMVVKPANESGGYGLLIGPKASRAELDEFKRRIEADPRNYIAQPVVALSRVPTIVDDHFEGRHVDLRPYILYGEDIWVLPGGLTRVALERGSLVVNSSQGGGSKDTWVLYDH